VFEIILERDGKKLTTAQLKFMVKHHEGRAVQYLKLHDQKLSPGISAAHDVSFEMYTLHTNAAVAYSKAITDTSVEH